MIEINPNVYTKDQLRMLLNLVHFPIPSVKEEVANLMIIVCDEFEDERQLMEV